MNIYVFMLSFSVCIILVLLLFIIRKQGRSQIKTVFTVNMILLLILTLSVLLQLLLSNKCDISPIYFEYFSYIGGCFLPVSIFFTGKILLNTKIKFANRYLLLFIVPIISLIVLWTNDFHHLFYNVYSTNISDGVQGPYMIVHNLYSYIMLFLGIFYMLKAATKNSGFFSKQSLLIIAGISVPVTVNLLGTLKIIPMTIYITPITFAIALLFIALAIFKFNFLGIAPITLQTIVNRISDGYLVLNESYIITDFNITLLKMFKIKDEDIRNKNILTFLSANKNLDIDITKFKKSLLKVKDSKNTISTEKHIESLKKYFSIEINTLYNKDSFLGILILIKDITQHTEDLQQIKNNQEILIEQERLASLGQMIGGISHNLKTPIMSISGAAEGITDLITEFDTSIGDPEVTNEDFHAIANDMKDWIVKIHSYTSYMSDIITAVKGQAVVLSESEEDTFTIDELLKRVNILMKNELQNGHTQLISHLNNLNALSIHGNVNSLVQVVNNLVANAIQSYKDSIDNVIDFTTTVNKDILTISISDHGCGMPNDVKNKLFKEMITTKGKNGTGLGLFMSYSTIKGKFDGDMNFTSEIGKGTTFNIIIPLLHSKK